MAKGNLIIPHQNSTTGCSFMSYPGHIIIIIIIIIVALGQHQWRCKQCVHNNNTGLCGEVNIPLITGKESPVCSIDIASIKCCCSKSCKGIKGLRIHQRSCKLVHNLGEEESTIDESCCEIEECPEVYLADHFEVNPGVRLPRSDNEWLLANTFFKSTFVNVVVNESSVNE